MANIQSIMIVDDSTRCTELMSAALGAAGAGAVLVENDSRVAIKRIVGGEAGLVLLDIKMPELNGFQVLDAVREAGCRIPILMCSGSVRQSDVNRAYASGCNGYFGKPDSLDQYRSLAKAIVEYWMRSDIPEAHKVG